MRTPLKLKEHQCMCTLFLDGLVQFPCSCRSPHTYSQSTRNVTIDHCCFFIDHEGGVFVCLESTRKPTLASKKRVAWW